MGGKYIPPQFCQRKSRREQLLPVTYSWDVTTIDCDMPLRKYQTRRVDELTPV